MAFSRNHALVMVTPDDPQYECKPSSWNQSHALSGADVGGIPYCPTATSETTSANLTYTETSGPRLQVGSGSTTLQGWILGQKATGQSGVWSTAVTPGASNYTLVDVGGDLYLNAYKTGGKITFLSNGANLASLFEAAGQGFSVSAGTATTDVNALSATQTWNAAVAFKANKTVVTPTSYSAGALMESWEYNTGQGTGVAMHTELTTIAAAATTDTTITIPANVIVLGVSVRVTVVIPTAATFTVTGATSGTAFQTGASVSTAATTTDAGTKSCPYLNTSAQAIRITPNAQPADNSGRVRVTIHYLAITPPTS